MTKGLEQMNFFSFVIKCKEKYSNSVILGSPNQISLKIGATDYQTRKQLNYGLKKGLIQKTNKGYILAKYTDILEHIDSIISHKHLHFYKKGTIKELTEKNLFVIMKNNFIQQQFRIKNTIRLKQLKSLATVKTEVNNLFSKRDYTFLQKNKHRVLGDDYIVTGQKHISKKLNISQGLASLLLDKWSKMGLFYRTLIYTTHFDKNSVDYSLNTSIPRICKGSKIILTS